MIVNAGAGEVVMATPLAHGLLATGSLPAPVPSRYERQSTLRAQADDFRKAATTSSCCSGCSHCGQWAAFSISWNRAPGITLARYSPTSGPAPRFRSVHSTSTGGLQRGGDLLLVVHQPGPRRGDAVHPRHRFAYLRRRVHPVLHVHQLLGEMVGVRHEILHPPPYGLPAEICHRVPAERYEQVTLQACQGTRA